MNTNTRPTPLSTDPEAVKRPHGPVRVWERTELWVIIVCLALVVVSAMMIRGLGIKNAQLTEVVRYAEANARAKVMLELEDAAVHHRSFYTTKYRIQCVAFQRRTHHERG